jgi:hypothetical protein
MLRTSYPDKKDVGLGLSTDPLKWANWSRLPNRMTSHAKLADLRQELQQNARYICNLHSSRAKNNPYRLARPFYDSRTAVDLATSSLTISRAAAHKQELLAHDNQAPIRR